MRAGCPTTTLEGLVERNTTAPRAHKSSRTNPKRLAYVAALPEVAAAPNMYASGHRGPTRHGDVVFHNIVVAQHGAAQHEYPTSQYGVCPDETAGKQDAAGSNAGSPTHEA